MKHILRERHQHAARIIVRHAAAIEDRAARRIVLEVALAAASGLRNLTMDDVARRAQVGRMTVYRRFGARSALIDALRLSD